MKTTQNKNILHICIDNYFDSIWVTTISLMDREKEHVLTYYIALSRVTKFSNLGIKNIEGISKNRLCRKIHKHPKIEKHLIEEDRLREMEQYIMKYFN